METSSRLFVLKKPIAGLNLLVYARKSEGYGFIEFEISNSIISTVFRNSTNLSVCRQPRLNSLVLLADKSAEGHIDYEDVANRNYENDKDIIMIIMIIIINIYIYIYIYIGMITKEYR